jgi:hypothetical protein
MRSIFQPNEIYSRILNRWNVPDTHHVSVTHIVLLISCFFWQCKRMFPLHSPVTSLIYVSLVSILQIASFITIVQNRHIDRPLSLNSALLFLLCPGPPGRSFTFLLVSSTTSRYMVWWCRGPLLYFGPLSGSTGFSALILSFLNAGSHVCPRNAW